MLSERGAGAAAEGASPSGTASSTTSAKASRLFASYHPSQQNTFTGKLKPADLDAVLAAVNRHLGRPEPRRT